MSAGINFKLGFKKPFLQYFITVYCNQMMVFGTIQIRLVNLKKIVNMIGC